MMKRLIFHPCVLFQHFKNTSLPTNVYLNDFLSNYSIQPALLSGSQRWRGQLPRRSGTCKPCKSHILQAFIQTSDVSGVPEWANDVQTHSKRCPFPALSSSQTYNILSPTSSPRSLIYILIRHKRDLLWCSHFFFFYSLHNLALLDVHRSAAGSEISDKTQHLLHLKDFFTL